MQQSGGCDDDRQEERARTQHQQQQPRPSNSSSSSLAVPPIPPPSPGGGGGSGDDSYYGEDGNGGDSWLRLNTSRRRPHYRPADAFRRVQRVSRHAALTTKQQLWDSNAVSIDAALSAVDQWEATYNALRSLLVASGHSARGLYGAAKEGSAKIEHGLLVPFRDWILLPAFSGVERAVGDTIGFFQSNQAQQLYGQSMRLARSVPWVGEPLLAPTVELSVRVAQRSWEIAQSPIPSKQQVHDTVDLALNGTKWALSSAGREIYLYAKRADANITRSLSHTRWQVLGSGPYATLDKLNKREVIDHLCERYFALEDALARYELAAHIRRHNRPLYHDLVLSGLLKDRGRDLTADDEWLSTCPSYRQLESEPFLLPTAECEDEYGEEGEDEGKRRKIAALWFRLPNVNGNRPGKDAPWICFRRSEILALEKRYRQVLREGQGDVTAATTDDDDDDDETATSDTETATASGATNGGEQREPFQMLDTPTKRGSNRSSDPLGQPSSHSDNQNSHGRAASVRGGGGGGDSRRPTVAQWYNPTLSRDVLVDQKRAAVSYFLCCPICREPLGASIPPYAQKQMGDLCESCQVQQETHMPSVAILLAPPPLCMVMRPTLWRFYGPGDSVRRATWFLDTSPRNGLQPFDEGATAILEDAYLFLRWMSVRQAFVPGRNNDNGSNGLEGALLTVEVPCPDGSDRLVQFSSLKQSTATPKGLGSAMALFKQRVYRGAWLAEQQDREVEKPVMMSSVEESLLQAVEDNGSLGDTLVPDMSIRSALTPKPPARPKENRLVLFTGEEDAATSLAVPPEQLGEKTLKYLDDEKSGRIDHLVLNVHGIGEMLRSIDVFGLSIPNLSSIIDCCAWLRINHADVQDAHFSQMYPTVDATSQFFTGRVEYLPVEWHEAFSILSHRRHASPDNHDEVSPSTATSNKVMLKDISLRTIPNMREFANDTLMDVLYFMSPEHHDLIIDVVTSEMNVVVERFRSLTGFSGRVSVVGHSLGSIISWDILNHQQNNRRGVPQVPSVGSIETAPGYFSPAAETSYVSGYAPVSDQPEVTQASSSLETPPSAVSYPQLDFQVDNFFLLGSPVPVFLMIRNQRQPLSDDFCLAGCNRVFNIFHPYDPVAYRIEPCIDRKNADFEPTIMTHWNGGFRVQYQTKRLWRQLIDTTWKTQQTVVEAFEASMAGMGLIDSSVDVLADDDASSSSDMSSADSRTTRVNTGALNRGRRIDYVLQEREIENANEYVFALAAHSAYWSEKDVSLFFARQIYLSTLEQAAKENAESWEPVPDD